MATTSKLEMSLDEIIKANKLKDAKSKMQPGKKFGVGARKGQQKTFKKSAMGTPKRLGAKRQLGRARFGGPQQKRKGNFGTPKGRVVGGMRRKPIGGGKRFGGGIGPRKNALPNNRAVMNAAENLVKKLVKKALTQPAAKGGIRGKFQRARVVPASNLLMSKISPRSRVIVRRPRFVAAVQQPAPVLIRRARRRPIRYATTPPIVQTAFVSPRPKFAPRRFNTVRYLQQQQQQPTSTMFVQQQPVMAPQFTANPSTNSVRDHINAMRRANTLQQLQAQFVAQSQPIVRQQQQPQFVVARQQSQQFVVQPVRQQRQRRVPQQQFVIQQQRPVQQHFIQQPQQQFVVAQQRQQFRRPQRQQWQQQPQQFVVRQQFTGGRRRPRQQPQQQQAQFVMDPSYVPPNFLQRF